MPFIQIIEYRTSRFEEVDQLGKEWEASLGSDTTASCRMLVRDRNDAERYLNIVFFDSYEEAMRNSDHPRHPGVRGEAGAPSRRSPDVLRPRRRRGGGALT